jgi:hypothetical protein
MSYYHLPTMHAFVGLARRQALLPNEALSAAKEAISEVVSWKLLTVYKVALISWGGDKLLSSG